MVQAPPLLLTRLLVSRKTTESTQSGNSKAREEHSRKEAQDRWERLVLAELRDTSKLVTDVTQSWHLNSHIRQSVPGAAAGTLRKYLQQWISWSEWLWYTAIHRGHPTQADMVDYVHEIITGAHQDTPSCSSHPELKVRQPQVEPLLATLDTPLIAGYLAGPAIPRPRREALPLPLAVGSDICARTRNPFHWWHSFHNMGRPPLRRQRSAHVPLHCFQTDMSYGESAGKPKSTDLPAIWCSCLWFFWTTSVGVGVTCTSVPSAIGTPRWWDFGGQNLVIDYLIPHMVYYDKRPVADPIPMHFSTGNDVSLRRALQAPQLRNARMTPRPSPAIHATQPSSHHAQHRKAGRCTRTPQG